MTIEERTDSILASMGGGVTTIGQITGTRLTDPNIQRNVRFNLGLMRQRMDAHFREAIADALDAASDRISNMMLDCGCWMNLRDWADQTRQPDATPSAPSENMNDYGDIEK